MPVGMFEVVFPLAPGDSGGPALVSMMKAPDLGYGSDTPELGRLNRSSVRGVLPKRQVTVGAVIVLEATRDLAAQRAFIHDNHMIEALTTDRAMSRST